MFEIIKSDLASRLAYLHTKHGKIQTPAYIPVIHPVKQTIPTSKIREMGFEAVITNAYITRKHFGDEAKKRGIHDIINFDKVVMTDSGGYQVLEYGDVDVSAEDIAKFQIDIGSDIAIPLDKPTGFGLTRKKAKSFVEQTLKVSKNTLKLSSNGQIWAGPIQGGEYLDLVKKSTKTLVDFGFPMLALGSPVEFMKSYEYKLLANMIITAKKQIPSRIPLHLFGAGHPLTIPMAVALGCDTFDSASYMLYAKNDRYITEDRTLHLRKISNFSCLCETCCNSSPKELLSLEYNQRVNKIALHNLYAIKAEVERVKEAIIDGRLWEYVFKKARAHPRLFEVIDVFTKNTTYFQKTTPRFKESAMFLYSKEDQFRPEIALFHNMVRRFKSKKKTIVIISDSDKKPFYLSPQYDNLKKKFSNHESVQFCQYNPFLGIIPLEVSDIYPAAHYVMAKAEYNPNDFPIFAKTWKKFFSSNNFTILYVDKNDEFLKFFVKSLPKSLRTRSIKL